MKTDIHPSLFFSSFCRNRDGVLKNAEEIERLKKICKDLEAKSTEDERKVSDLNVNIENLTMNVSLNNRTVQGLLEDRKLRCFGNNLGWSVSNYKRPPLIISY